MLKLVWLTFVLLLIPLCIEAATVNSSGTIAAVPGGTTDEEQSTSASVVLNSDVIRDISRFTSTVKEVSKLRRVNSGWNEAGAKELEARHKGAITTVFAHLTRSGIYYQKHSEISQIQDLQFFSYRTTISPVIVPALGNGFSFISGWLHQVHRYNAATSRLNSLHTSAFSTTSAVRSGISSALCFYPSYEDLDRIVLTLAYYSPSATYRCTITSDKKASSIPCENPPFPEVATPGKILTAIYGTEFIVCLVEGRVIAAFDMESRTGWKVILDNNSVPGLWNENYKPKSIYVSQEGELCLSVLDLLEKEVVVYCRGQGDEWKLSSASVFQKNGYFPIAALPMNSIEPEMAKSATALQTFSFY